MIRIYLVDDHQLVRAGLRSLVESEQDLTVIGDFGSGEAVLEACRRKQPDVVLMDVNMPGMGGTDATRRVVRQFPSVRVITVTALHDDPFPQQLMDAGASGILSKSSSRVELLEAIRTVMQGQHFIASEVAKALTLSNLRSRGEGSPIGRLTPRERQVMMMVIQGYGNREICSTLFLSPKTVYTYRTRVFEKLDVSNDVELTHFGIRHGLIDTLP